MDDSSASGPKSRKGDEEKGCLQPCPLSRTIKKEMSEGISFLIQWITILDRDSACGFRVIGQKVLIKTAVAIEISMAMAVLSCF